MSKNTSVLKVLFFLTVLLLFAKDSCAANFTNAQAITTNSRFSYKAKVLKGDKNTDRIQIKSSGAPNIDTKNLFPKDTICFLDNTKKCKGNKTYTVTRIIDDSTFSIYPQLEINLSESDYVLATQQTILIITLDTTLDIPEDGEIVVSFPAVDVGGETNDGLPDTSSTTYSNGFDLNKINSSHVVLEGCGNQNWQLTEIKEAGATTHHAIRMKRINSTCPQNSKIVIGIGNPEKGLVIPTLVTSDPSASSNIYNLNIRSKTATGGVIDTIDVKVAPFSGVLVTAQVGEFVPEIFEKYRLTLYGYTSPRAQVTIDRINQSAYADNKGYFEFKNISLLSFLPELCLTAKDQVGRLTPPVCIPTAPTTYNPTVGPVILPPTVSLNRGEYVVGDEAVLSGQTVPDSEVLVSVFTKAGLTFRSMRIIPEANAFSFPKLKIKSDEKGNFNISLPSSSDDKYNLFASVKYQNDFSLKSNSLVYSILPFWAFIIQLLLILLSVILSRIGEIIILALIAVLTYYLYKRFHPHEVAKNRALALRELHPLVKRG